MQTFKLNALETMYLTTSLFILLAGMAFQSGVATPGTGPHTALTYFVMIVLVGSVRDVVETVKAPSLPLVALTSVLASSCSMTACSLAHV